jgi:hypothetical protein
MKVELGKYKRWIGPYQIADMLKHVGLSEERCYSIGEALAKTSLSNICNWIDSKRKRKVYVRIDRYDTWNMDHTLAMIIHPMLKQIRETKHGSPYVDEEDVPEELRLGEKYKNIFDHSYSSEYTEEEKELADEKFHARWQYMLDEMIWAFEQIANEEDGPSPIDSKEEYIEFHNRIANGTLLFGKYYRNLWD